MSEPSAAAPSVAKTTVVHIITRLELGGAQENTLYTCRHLDRSQHRVALIIGPGGLLDDEAYGTPDLHTIAVPELVRAVHPLKDFRATKKLKVILSDLLFEHGRLGHPPSQFIVHTHSSKAGIVGRTAARWAGVPHVVHSIHGFGFYEGQDWKRRALFVNAERVAALSTDAFISVSLANLEEAWTRRIIRPGTLTRLIRSGMDLRPFRDAPPREVARRELGLADDAEVIVSIANFKVQKDPLTMVEAVRQLAARRPKVCLLYAGDGELRPEVEAAVSAAGLQERVTLMGWRRDIPRLMSAADVVALSSLFEGLPRTAVQAVAAGRPFVGTRVDGTPEIVRDGENGFLVPPRNPVALSWALEKALIEQPVDPSDAHRLRAWSADVMVREQESLYRQLVEGP